MPYIENTSHFIRLRWEDFLVFCKNRSKFQNLTGGGYMVKYTVKGSWEEYHGTYKICRTDFKYI